MASVLTRRRVLSPAAHRLAGNPLGYARDLRALPRSVEAILTGDAIFVDAGLRRCQKGCSARRPRPASTTRYPRGGHPVGRLDE